MKKPMKKPVKKFKRFQDGGDVAAAKQRGLDISNKEEPVGFFERIRMGNIDEPGSEAYNRFGAGRGRSARTPVNESVSVSGSEPVARPSMQPRPIVDPQAVQDADNPRVSSPALKPTVPTKSAVVTKEELAKSGLSLRDYMNKQQGLTRRKEKNSTSKPIDPRNIKSDVRYDDEGLIDPKNIRNERLNFEESQRPAASAASQITGQSVKAPKGEKIDSSESGRNVGNALMATGALGLGAAGLYKAKKMFDAAKKLKAGIKKRPGKDFMDGLTVSDMTAKKRGGTVKKYASGGMVSSASKRADGIAVKGKTRGKMC